MDRFIELVDNLFTDLKNNLKSNMDRFIVTPSGVVDFRIVI